MSGRRRPWIRCPTSWIFDPEILGSFDWRNSGTANVTALMCLTVIIHESDTDTGIATGLTYDRLENATYRSRTSISKGLAVLKERGLIENYGSQSCYQQKNFPVQNEKGWGKMPWQSMYRNENGEGISFFKDFSLRKKTELDALKLFYLFIALRNNQYNHAKVSYDKISERTKIGRNFIRPAISLLINAHLVAVEVIPSTKSDYGTALAYRLTGISPHIHAGTTGRELLNATQTTFDDQGDAVF